MNKWIPIAVVAIVIAVIGLGVVSDFDGFDRGDRTEVGRVVTTSDGETLVVYEDDHRGGFFPFGFLIFPLFWILVIGGIFALFRRSTWRGPGRLAKRQNMKTSESKNQEPKNSANPTSIKYGVGLRTHFEKRYTNIAHAPISPADVVCLPLVMVNAAGR